MSRVNDLLRSVGPREPLFDPVSQTWDAFF